MLKLLKENTKSMNFQEAWETWVTIIAYKMARAKLWKYS